MFEDSESRFLAFMIASEVVITLIAFVGAYYIFKPLLKPKDMDDKETSLSRENEEADEKALLDDANMPDKE